MIHTFILYLQCKSSSFIFLALVGMLLCITLSVAAQTGAAPTIQVIELRNYTLVQGQRLRFVEFMNQVIIPRQESLQGYILNQCSLQNSDSNYVWIRAFKSMDSRHKFLRDFYKSEYWKQHRAETNSMLTNIEYIYLLKPIKLQNHQVDTLYSLPMSLWPSTKPVAVVQFFKPNPETSRAQLLDWLASEYATVLKQAMAPTTFWWISEMRKNEFWLAAIQDPELVVGITFYDSEADFFIHQKRVSALLATQANKALASTVTQQVLLNVFANK